MWLKRASHGLVLMTNGKVPPGLEDSDYGIYSDFGSSQSLEPGPPHLAAILST